MSNTIRRNNVTMCLTEENKEKVSFTIWLDDFYKIRYENWQYTLQRRVSLGSTDYVLICTSSVIDNVMLEYKKDLANNT